jgi:hypothetical protein
MMNKAPNAFKPPENLFGGVLLAHLVLVLHVILILGLGACVFFFGGVITYLPWVLTLGGVLVVSSAYLWWKHIKRRGRKLRDALKDPLFQGRTVEVSLLGGLASVRLGQSQEPLAIPHEGPKRPKQLMDPSAPHAEQLASLARLLKDDIITIDEFLAAKKELKGQ